MHGCGKGILINLCSQKLNARNQPFRVVRGEGSRVGSGEELQDPVCD